MPARHTGEHGRFAVTVVVDAHDLPALARFWSQVLNWKVVFEADDEIVIGADESALPGITFVPVAERKTAKNRLHIAATSSVCCGRRRRCSTSRWGRVMYVRTQRCVL